MTQVPLARLLSTTLRLAVDQMHERLAAEGFDDLRPVHGYVLNAADAEGATASDIAALLGISKQAVAKLIAELSQLGYLERGVTADDGRRRPVHLTQRGAVALETSERIQREIEAEWAATVGAGRLATTRRSLEGVLAMAADEGRSVPLRPTW